MERRVKIVATIGPASDSEAVLEALLRAGVNVARLNFSHGTHEQHVRRIRWIHAIAERLKISVGILQDLQGPKIRVGKLATPLQLAQGENVLLYVSGAAAPRTDKQTVPVDFRE